jgi:hypothetical protein
VAGGKPDWIKQAKVQTCPNMQRKEGCVLRAHLDRLNINYMKDEGKPFGAGLQEQASNYLKLPG